MSGTPTYIALPESPLAKATRVVASAGVNILLVSLLVAAADTNCIGFTIWNNSANSAYIVFGPTATSAAPTYIHPTFSTLAFFGPVIYTGVISSIRNAGSGTIVVTRFYL